MQRPQLLKPVANSLREGQDIVVRVCVTEGLAGGVEEILAVDEGDRTFV